MDLDKVLDLRWSGSHLTFNDFQKVPLRALEFMASNDIRGHGMRQMWEKTFTLLNTNELEEWERYIPSFLMYQELRDMLDCWLRHDRDMLRAKLAWAT